MGYCAWISFPDNYIALDSTLGSVNEDTNFPAQNAAILPVSRPAIINGINSEVLTIGLSRARSADFFALIGHNLTDTATITLRGGSTPNPDGTQFQTSVSALELNTCKVFSAAENWQYWSVEFTDNTQRDGFIRVGYMVLGTLQRPDFNFQYGWGYNKLYRNLRPSTDFGNPLVSSLFEQIQLNAQFGPLDSADMTVLTDLLNQVTGDAFPVLFMPDVSGSECLLGRFDPIAAQRREYYRYMSVTFTEDGHGRVGSQKDPLIYVPGYADLELSDLDATIARSTTATYIDVGGYIRTAAIDVARENHFDASGVRTLLVEGSRTNEYTYSEQFDNAAWSKVRTSISANAAVAPDGELTADKLVEDSSAANTHYVTQTLPALTDDTLQAFTVYAAPAERTWLHIQTGRKDGAGPSSFIDLANGALGTTASAHTVTLRSVANGFTEIRVVYDCLSGGSTPYVHIGLSDGDNGSTYNGDGSSGAYIWGAQFEKDIDSGAGTSYIPTISAAVTRATDEISIPFADGQKAMTVYVRFIETGMAQATYTPRLLFIGDEDNPNTGALFMIYAHGSQDRYVAQLANANGDDSISTHGTDVSVGDVVELRTVISEDGSATLYQTLNGGSEVAGGTGSTISLSAAFEAQTLILASDWANHSYAPIAAVKVLRGIQDLDTMRDAAGSSIPVFR